jgi:hypothetical protein
MRERVGEFQGSLDISSQGRGTLLRVEMPLPVPAAENATASGPPNIQTQVQLDAEELGNTGDGLTLFSLPA